MSNSCAVHSNSSGSSSNSHSDNFKCNSEQLKKQARRNKNVCCGALPSISAIAAACSIVAMPVSPCVCVCMEGGGCVVSVCIVGWMPCTPVALFSHCCFTLIFCQCNMRTKATTACSFCCCYAVTHTDKIEKAELVQGRKRETER